jgi:hypothetical protein
MQYARFMCMGLVVAASVQTNPRLALSNENSVTVSWQAPAGVPCQKLLFGYEQDSVDHYVTAYRMCDVYGGDTFYHAELPASQNILFYRVECSTDIHSTLASLKSTVDSFKLAVYGDLGPLHGDLTLKALYELRSELSGHIFAGDIGYADDAFLHAQSYVSRMNEFFRAISPTVNSIPVMVAPGNHEAEDHTPFCLLSPGCRAGLGNFTAYNCAWNMPSKDHRHSMWYSFNYGPIHFVMTNTETDYRGAPLEPYGELGNIPTGAFGLKGEYEDWLRQDITKAASERHIRPWIIVVGHRPITVLDDKSDPFVTPLNEEMIDLITTHADAYIAGHVHYYARSTPKLNSFIKTRFITVGGSGCDEWNERRIQDTRKGETEMFEYFGFGEEQTYGTLSFDRNRDSELVFELFTSRENKLIDRVILPRREHKGTPSTSTVILTQ